MSRLLLISSSLLQLVSTGSYAPPPPVQPSISSYGSPLSYGYASYEGNSLPGAVAPPVPTPPVVPPILPTNPPQIYSYPIQANQAVYNSPAPVPVYSDIVETTTLLPPPPPPTTPLIPPVVEQIEDTEKYGVPEISSTFNANPQPAVSLPQPVPVAQQQGGYAPPPLVQPAVSAYGAPASSSSYGAISNAISYNALEFNAGEVPTAVVQPGTLPAPPAPSVPSSYPARAIRSQKKTAEQRKKAL